MACTAEEAVVVAVLVASEAAAEVLAVPQKVASSLVLPKVALAKAASDCCSELEAVAFP